MGEQTCCLHIFKLSFYYFERRAFFYWIGNRDLRRTGIFKRLRYITLYFFMPSPYHYYYR
jgi:hypothetical protein